VLRGIGTPRVKSMSLNALYILLVVLAFAAPVSAYRIMDDSTIVIYWTAPGDDSLSGRAAVYDLHYSPIPPVTDTAGWWNGSPRLFDASGPSFAGHRDSIVVTGLDFQKRYYFALKSADEEENWSRISNIAVFPDLTCADVNGDGTFNLADATYILAYYYNGGPAPIDGTGDVNGSGNINLIDATFLIKYLQDEGPPPFCDGGE